MAGATCCAARRCAATPGSTTRTTPSSSRRCACSMAAAGIAASLGRNGRRFFQANYAWPIIEKKYLDMFARLSREPVADRAGRSMEPIPGWWRRRQRSLAPAREVLTGLPAGPVRPGAAPDRAPRRRTAPAGEPGRAPRPATTRRRRASARPEREPATERPERSRRDGQERSSGGGAACRPTGVAAIARTGGDRSRRGAGPSAPAAPGGSPPAAARPAGRGRVRRGRNHRRPEGKQGS